MMTPRLQMKSPCTYNLDEVKSIDIHLYLSRFGFVGGIETAWFSCVKRMYEDFEAPFAANEGLDTVIRDLAPSRRRLTVSKISPKVYSFECEQESSLGQQMMTRSFFHSKVESLLTRKRVWILRTMIRMKRPGSSATSSEHTARFRSISDVNQVIVKNEYGRTII